MSVNVVKYGSWSLPICGWQLWIPHSSVRTEGRVVGRGEGHSHVEKCNSCICQSTHMQILHPLPPSMLPLSLMQVVTLTTLQRLDQTPAVKQYFTKLWTVNYIDSCNAVT